MGELKSSDSLDVILGAPDYTTLQMNPNEGRKFDCWESTKEFNLYLDRDDFIESTDNFMEVELDQPNDCEKGVLVIKNKLRKELDHPEKIKLFRKNDNIFLKPLDT